MFSRLQLNSCPPRPQTRTATKASTKTCAARLERGKSSRAWPGSYPRSEAVFSFAGREKNSIGQQEAQASRTGGKRSGGRGTHESPPGRGEAPDCCKAKFIRCSREHWYPQLRTSGSSSCSKPRSPAPSRVLEQSTQQPNNDRLPAGTGPANRRCCSCRPPRHGGKTWPWARSWRTRPWSAAVGPSPPPCGSSDGAKGGGQGQGSRDQSR